MKTNLFSRLWALIVSFLAWLTGIKLVDQYPPLNWDCSRKYPNYFQTRWYSCRLGRFIRTAGYTDDFPKLTYIIGRGKGYINSFQIVLRWPSSHYTRQMGGFWNKWKGRNRFGQDWPTTPWFSLYWSIAPRFSSHFFWLRWLEWDGYITTRGIGSRIMVSRPTPNYHNIIYLYPRLNWGSWYWSVHRYFEARRWAREDAKLEAEGRELSGSEDRMYRAQYEYAAGYRD